MSDTLWLFPVPALELRPHHQGTFEALEEVQELIDQSEFPDSLRED